MILLYFIKCFVSMGIAWSIYKLILAKKKSFIFNRWFLLFSIVGLALVPFLSLPRTVAPVVEPIVPQIENLVTFAINLNEAPVDTLVEATASSTAKADSSTTFKWIWIFYIVGFVLFFRIIYNIAKLSIAAYRNYNHSEHEIRVIDSNYKNTPFSFFNNLFLSTEQMKEGLPEEVLAHELCHINHFHSIDRIVVELVLLIQWWNPFAHLLIRSLKDNHEFTADDYALRSKGESNKLIDQILSYSTIANYNHLFQIGFAQHSVLKRIRMINAQSNKLSIIGGLISTILIVFICFSCSDLVEDKAHREDVELTIVKGHLNDVEYQFPTEFVNRVHDPHILTGWPEYRSPSRVLLKKFKTDDIFEIELDGERQKTTNLSTYLMKI